MALWQNAQINSISIGTNVNDGTGDTVREAFRKTRDNFANVSTFLSSTSVDFLNTNVAKLRVSDTVTLSSVIQLANISTSTRDTLVPTPSNGMLIYNNTYNKFQGYANGAWGNITLS